jgi:hypothetical protein
MSPTIADMSSDTTCNTDLYTVPKLEPDGHNWIMFKNQLEWALAACGVTDHLHTQKAPKPTVSDSATPDEKADYETKLATWEKTEFTCCQQLTHALPDSVLWKILHEETMANMWSTIKMEFELKTVLVQAELCACF